MHVLFGVWFATFHILLFQHMIQSSSSSGSRSVETLAGSNCGCWKDPRILHSLPRAWCCRLEKKIDEIGGGLPPPVG
jgi:hypothetical protein